MTPHERAAKGARFEIENNEVLKEAFDKTREQIHSEWENKSPDPEAREEKYRELKALDQLRKRIQVVIDDGLSARKDIEYENGART